MKIIDFHTHAFTDSLAERAIKTLEAEAFGVKAHLNGTISALFDSMDRAGIYKSVVCNIATKPGQFDPIVKWCEQIRSERIEPLPSIHPDDNRFAEQLEIISSLGFKGIKLHPFYQRFYADDKRLYKIYEILQELQLMLVMHTGYDIAFPEERRADPKKVLRISEDFPDMVFVATHLGGWKQWEEVEEFLLGKNIYMEISFSLQYLSEDKARYMLQNHPANYLLFGTDSPWADQLNSLEMLEGLSLEQEITNNLLYMTANKLLS